MCERAFQAFSFFGKGEFVRSLGVFFEGQGLEINCGVKTGAVLLIIRSYNILELVIVGFRRRWRWREESELRTR